MSASEGTRGQGGMGGVNSLSSLTIGPNMCPSLRGAAAVIVCVSGECIQLDMVSNQLFRGRGGGNKGKELMMQKGLTFMLTSCFRAIYIEREKQMP